MAKKETMAGVYQDGVGVPRPAAWVSEFAQHQQHVARAIISPSCHDCAMDVELMGIDF